MGIQLKCMKSRSVEDVGESVRLDVQMEFSEIHVSVYKFRRKHFDKKVSLSPLSTNVIYHVVAAQRIWHLYCGDSEA